MKNAGRGQICNRFRDENDRVWWTGYSGGGALMDMGIHCIDLLQYVTGLKVQSVNGMWGNQIFQYPDVEDAAGAVMKMDNGAMFTVEANFNIPDTIGGCRFEIYGTKGGVVAERTIGQTETGRGYYYVNENAKAGYVSLTYESGNMYTKEIEGFSKAVLEYTEMPVTAEDGILNQKIVEAVYESQEKGIHVRV